MPSYLVKLADDEYVEWSTVVDAPLSYICERERAVSRWGEDRVARADEHVTSHTDPDFQADTPERAIAVNRAGDDESELTLAELRERYRRVK